MLETLERRLMWSVTLKGDVLHVAGTEGADVIEFRSITRATASIPPFTSTSYEVSVNGERFGEFPQRNLRVRVRSFGGDDLITARFPEIMLDTGEEPIRGYRLIVDAGDGNDSVFGGPGRDLIHGGRGDDRITSTVGFFRDRDFLIGGPGNDTIAAGPGRDTILAGPGNDSVSAGDGSDIVHGGRGNDTLDGGSGADLLRGWFGHDTLIGGLHGREFVWSTPPRVEEADRGVDTLAGGEGEDEVAWADGDLLRRVEMRG